jgi:ABC-type transport system involved in cytochrome bd biosynthesis fused ATPase/permease subunit
MFGLDSEEYEGPSKALNYIRGIINLLLGLTSFVALVMIIYSFYLLFFSEDTKGMDKVKKNLKGVAIALIILGLSRTIVSFIFNFYQNQIAI